MRRPVELKVQSGRPRRKPVGLSRAGSSCSVTDNIGHETSAFVCRPALRHGFLLAVLTQSVTRTTDQSRTYRCDQRSQTMQQHLPRARQGQEPRLCGVPVRLLTTSVAMRITCDPDSLACERGTAQRTMPVTTALDPWYRDCLCCNRGSHCCYCCYCLHCYWQE